MLMQEIVTLIEQRNAIINCLDEDRQREEEEDKMLEAMIKKKGEGPSWDSGPLELLEWGGQVEQRVGAGATGMACVTSQPFW